MTSDALNGAFDSDGNEINAFSEALHFLETRIDFEKLVSFSTAGMECRLEQLRDFLQCSGSPERAYRTIHVAGTKGKGSTCAMLEAVLRKGGYRVGRFTSPHLYSLLERFLVDGEPCRESEFAERMLSLRDRIAVSRPELLDQLTYFELTTLFAFEYFAEKEVDFAIFEVGLGGRLDATNICRPCLTLISSISFDHIEQLGPTLGQIATEKGGIIKPGIPLVSTVRNEEAKAVLRRIAEEKGAPAFFLDESFEILPPSGMMSEMTDGFFRFRTMDDRFPVSADLDCLHSSLPGRHQQRNASLTVAGILILRSRGHCSIDDESIRTGLADGFVPIRIEMIRPDSAGPLLIVDGGHNRASIGVLIEMFRERFPDRRITMFFGTSLGKDVEGMFAELIPHIDRLVLTQHPFHPRRFPPQGLKTILYSQPMIPDIVRNNLFHASEQGDSDILKQAILRKESFSLDGASNANKPKYLEVDVAEDAAAAFEKAWREAKSDELICVSGSMFLAAELRKIFFERFC